MDKNGRQKNLKIIDENKQTQILINWKYIQAISCQLEYP